MQIEGGIGGSPRFNLCAISFLSLAFLAFGCGGGGDFGGSTSNAIIDGLIPEHGPSAGGIQCTIAGQNFNPSGLTTVLFGKAQATNVTVVDPCTIVCIVPPNQAGKLNVTVSHGEDGLITLPKAFTYHDAPAVTGVAPDSGPTTGGTKVVVSGGNFTKIGATTATFGGVPASDLTIVSDNIITCKAPANGVGGADVAVINDFGSDVIENGFLYYLPAAISAIVPPEGGVDGGTECVIIGSNFPVENDVAVLFGLEPAQEVVVVNATRITCLTPPQPPAVVEVVVHSSRGTARLDSGFTYHNIVAIDPAAGPVEGGMPVTIYGSGFTTTEDTVVTFGGEPALDLVVLDAETMTCTAPPAAASGPADVHVANSLGYDTVEGGFTYGTVPDVLDIAPRYSGTGGGAPVTITGSGFTREDTIVAFGGIAALDVVVADPATITCTAPPHAAGKVDVAVSNAFGSDVLPQVFAYHNPPSVSGVWPGNGPAGGGTAVTIMGADFCPQATAAVAFGGAAAADVVVVNATTITCTTPQHDPGAVDVTVSNVFGSDTLPAGYTYNGVPNPPEIFGVAPAHGGAAGGTLAAVSGSGFTAGTTVSFGGVAALDVVVVSSTAITCATPPHAAGSVDVTVANLHGADTLPNGFTYHNAPVVSAVAPDNGPPSGGTPVTISGANFSGAGATQVGFGGVPAANVVIVSSTQITCVAPAHAAGTVGVTVVNQFGSDTLAGGYTYNDAPNISSINHQHGGVAGGTPVTITGSGFTSTADTTVTFGGLGALEIKVVDAGVITCKTPAHAAGAVDVTVANSNGADTLPNGFTYHNAPAVSAVAPDSGPASGGAPVTITGSNFSAIGDTAVTFGGAAAGNVVVVSAAVITCMIPAHASGEVDVTVTNDFGSGSLPGGFTYLEPPVVAAVTPSEGEVAGNTYVAIAGSNFTSTPDTAVTFGGVAANSVAVIDSATIICRTPAHAAGSVDVRVENSNGAGVLPGGFTYREGPQVLSVAPGNGPAAGGTEVTITGTNFTGAATVTFGGVSAANVHVLSPTAITCATPAHDSGAVDVSVANDFGSDTLTGGFRYDGPPVVDEVDPDHGAAAGGTNVVIKGNGFTAAADTTVTFGGIAASNIAVPNAETIVCRTPAHSAGAVDVVVSNSNGSDTLSGGFTFVNPPTISSAAPDSGPTAGGTAVTVTGSGFSAYGATEVRFGGAPAAGVTVVSSTTITCTTPAHGAGVVDVVVSNDFGEDTLPGGFTYAGPPSITGVAPAEGGTDGGTFVTITGSGFADAQNTTVTFGGAEAEMISVVDDATITCETPPHAAGAVTVAVSNSNGSDTQPSGFTYRSPPSIESLSYSQNGNQITLIWALSSPADEIVIYRGAAVAAILDGSATSHVLTESGYGYYRYTVGLFVGGDRVDQDSVLVDLGRVVWDPPEGPCTGFFLYVAEAIGDPENALPYDDPMDFSCDVGFCCEVPLKSLFEDALITGGKTYYLAVSSYSGNPANIVSELTEAVTFAYEVVIAAP